MNGSLAVAATLTALQCGLSAAGMSTAAVSRVSHNRRPLRRPRYWPTCGDHANVNGDSTGRERGLGR